MARARRSESSHHGEAGMATAEFAVALPAVALVLALVVALTQLLLLHHRAWHAASVGARVAARGEDDAAVRRSVGTTGLRAGTTVERDGVWVRVSVSAPAPRALAWAVGDVTVEAVAAAERADGPGAAGDVP